MDLNEIIENNTIEQISRRTRLTEENLEKLFSQDFKGLTKVQALGFISILEREYRTDLSDMRNKCLEYFGDIVKTNNNSKAQSVPPKSVKDSAAIPSIQRSRFVGKYVKPVAVIIATAVLLYAAWQSYSSSMQSDGNIVSQNSNGGFFSSIVNQTKSWMGGDENITENVSQYTEAEQKGWADEDKNQKNTFVITEQPKEAGKEDIADKADNEENKTIKKIKLEQAQQEKPKTQTTLEEIQQTDQAIANLSQENNISKQQALAAEVPSIKTEAKKSETNIFNISEKTATVSIVETKQNLQKAQEVKKKAEEKAKAEEIARKKAQEQAAAEKAAQEAARQKALAAKAAKEKALKEKLAKEKAAKEAASKKALAEKAKKAKAAKEKASKEKAAQKAKLVLIPSKNIWLGIVDLKTMKRKVSKTLNSVSFDDPRGRWIIATGHGYFTFKDSNRVIKFNDGKKHYLIVQKGVMHEIPHETFQKLNQSKVW